jgi:hypothetical protein
LTPIAHAIPSPAQEQAAADLASLPVEMFSRSTTTVFGVQAALLCAGWQQTLLASQAVADAWKAVAQDPLH